MRGVLTLLLFMQDKATISLHRATKINRLSGFGLNL